MHGLFFLKSERQGTALCDTAAPTGKQRGAALCVAPRCFQRGNSVGHEFSARCDTAHLFSVVLGLSNLESPTTSKKKKRANIFRFCLRSIRLAEDRQVKALYLFILHIWYCFYSSTSSLSFSHLSLFFSRVFQSVPIPLLAYCNNLDAHVALSLFFFFISRVTRTLSACFYQSAAFILVCFSSCSFMLLSRQLARFFFQFHELKNRIEGHFQHCSQPLLPILFFFFLLT